MKTWDKAKTQCVYRHGRSGRYYVRYASAGKKKQESMETDFYRVARLRAADKLMDVHRETAHHATDFPAGYRSIG